MARKKRNSIDVRDGFHTIVMADMEIWDGADLALLRETLARLVDTDGEKLIGVDMTFVKYVPSGFFGMLYDYTERGATVRVYRPLPHVREMLWFREFFDALDDGAYELALRTETSMSNGEAKVGTQAPWSSDANPVPVIEPIIERRDHAVVVP
jgi:hypothetical protein